MSRRSWLAALLLVFAAGATLRTLWLTADPPTTVVGVVWHDEGAWVHNARNRALFDTWRTDNWNPVYVAPVFTALEYAAFELVGVGTWQARTVPVASGLLALAFLIAGLHAAAGRRVALFGGALLATNYIFVMWNRAALMESTMTAFIVVSWGAYAMGERRPAWGAAAGAAAVLAWFTKAAAAFFVAALVLDAVITLAVARLAIVRDRWQMTAPSPAAVRTAGWTLAGLTAAGVAVMLAFVLPHWSEYSFYNWQMSVTRKPAYGLRDLMDRASWLPVVQDVFSRMWLVLLGSALAIAGMTARWRSARPAERLLVLWVLLGLLELVVHDAGNARRYVMFIPALVALAALVAAGGAAFLPAGLDRARWRTRLLAAPLLLLLGYLLFGSLTRLLWLDDVHAGRLSTTVRVSAVLSLVLTAAVLARWPAVTRRLAGVRVAPGVAAALLGVALVWNLGQYGAWAAARGDLNYRASIELGRLLPPGTLVHGKLANGMALENRIRPVFIGTEFGNYADRFERDDVRYILTYTLPAIGYESGPEGRLIRELLDHYPAHTIVATFDVDETPGPDRAALIDKIPGRPDAPPPDADRPGGSRARD